MVDAIEGGIVSIALRYLRVATDDVCSATLQGHSQGSPELQCVAKLQGKLCHSRVFGIHETAVLLYDASLRYSCPSMIGR